MNSSSPYKYAYFPIKLAGILLLLFTFFGCGIKRTIPSGKYLLKKNEVKIESEYRKEGELKAQILHRTNKRVFFNQMPIFLWIYALGTYKYQPELSDSVGWRRKFRHDLGEEPVLLNQTLVNISTENIKNFLFNEGFFDASCTATIEKKGRNARVVYLAKTESPYKISAVNLDAPDSILAKMLDSAIKSNDKFRLWWPCNLNNLNAAKDDFSKLFRDNGYFTVSSESFRFTLDTNKTSKQAVVKVIMDPPKNGNTHKKFNIGSVLITVATNSVYSKNKYPEIVRYPGLLIKLNHYPLNAYILDKVIRLDSAEEFSQTRWTESYRGLLDLGLFSSVNIGQTIDEKNGIISPIIELKTAPRMSVSTEPQLLYSPQGSSGLNFQTSAQRSFGLAGILSFTNRNTFGNAEYFKFSTITSYEAIFKKENFGDFFTGLQQGVVASLKLPSFERLDNIKAIRRYDQKSTLLSMSFQYEQNPNFTRSSLPASVSLQFIGRNFSWYYTPVEISYNRNIIDPNFLPQLPKLDQDFVRRVFTDQIITPVKLGMIYADNQNKPGKTSKFVRLGLETSGNFHRFYRYLTESNFVSDSSYKLFGVGYFQYTKLEAEIRLKQNIDEINSVAFRFNSGLAIPYGNSSVVPYDKRYFIGGSNSLRAWKPRGLGPGNTPKSTTSLIDRSGELILEANLEYRFVLVRKLLEAAIFLDAGNIWNLNKLSVANADYGVFHRNSFVQEIALNTGIGFRFDLSIFMFRVDWGLPIRDPSFDKTQRWLLSESIQNNTMRNYILNESAIAIGIGYPF